MSNNQKLENLQVSVASKTIHGHSPICASFPPTILSFKGTTPHDFGFSLSMLWVPIFSLVALALGQQIRIDDPSLPH